MSKYKLTKDHRLTVSAHLRHDSQLGTVRDMGLENAYIACAKILEGDTIDVREWRGFGFNDDRLVLPWIEPDLSEMPDGNWGCCWMSDLNEGDFYIDPDDLPKPPFQ